MSLIDPKELIVASATFFNDFDMTYTESFMGLKQHANFGMVSFDNRDFLPTGQSIVWTVPGEAISPEVVYMYIHVRNLIVNLVSNAEYINSQFLKINKTVLGKTEEELNVPGAKDFMTLKNNVVSYVKRDQETNHLLSRALRTSLECFVSYRNIFTHGKLRLLCVAPEGFVNSKVVYPNELGKRRLTPKPGRLSTYEWYITYLDTSKGLVSIKITKELLEDYGKIYEETIAFLHAFNTVKPVFDPIIASLKEYYLGQKPS
ncbi:hypothetical protein [Hymenobacter sp. PAMC 26628]|uniref:hypothetical protein n=1 Tax=Hymenobacter sp. PAMC 26628 TaxID=1484118 RepID=UPI0012FFCF39|nr:hypothetical protein [Hymenobacter sp. PAMC 26628]